MDSASKLSTLVQPFGVGEALKSWFGLFNLFLEASQIVIVEDLHAFNASDSATSRGLLKRQLQLITSSRSTILASGTEMNNLPVAAGLACARRVERTRAYQRKRYTRLKSFPCQCGPLW